MLADRQLETFSEMLSDSKKLPISDYQLKAFAKELDSLKKEIEAKIGQEDVDYIKTVTQISQYSEILGRTLIHFSKDLISWSTGVFLLYIHLMLDNLEIKHHALHGAYDNLEGAEKFHSDVFKSDSPVDEESWKYRHNHLHHSYTNQIDKDPDVTFGFFRFTEKIDKQFFHLFQPLLLILNALGSDHNLNLVSTDLFSFINRIAIPGYEKLNYAGVKKEYDFMSFLDSTKNAARKAIPYMSYNFLLFPALAGPFGALKVGLGTTAAMTLRNIVSGVVFYTGHMTENIKHYDVRPKNRAEWYVQQIEGSSNVDSDKLFSIIVGHLNYQIEHHIFPKLTPNRLDEVAPRVKSICEKYGVNYNTGTAFEQITSVFKNGIKYAWLIK